MAAHSCPALPVPAVTEIGRAEIGPTRIAVYFAVSERAPGRILNDLDAAGLRAVLPGLLTALDAARDIDVTGSGGYGLRDPGGRGPYLTWPDALLACNQETERIPSWRAALERSPSARARSTRPTADCSVSSRACRKSATSFTAT